MLHATCTTIPMFAMYLLALNLAIKITKHNVGTGTADTEHAKVDHDLLGFQRKSGACDSICCGKVQHMKVMLGRLKPCSM